MKRAELAPSAAAAAPSAAAPSADAPSADAADALDVALVGCGRWGRRLLAALQDHPRLRVTAVADADAGARRFAARRAPQARIVSRPVDALAEAQAVLIATPSQAHARHALQALEAGRDVFVEKPLALCRQAAEQLCEVAERHQRIGMVGHVLRFDQQVERFVAALRSGRVGSLRQVSAQRLTQSRSPAPLWTLAPHDVATLLAVDGGEVAEVEARAEAGRQRLTLLFRSGLQASIEVDTQAAEPRRQTRARGTDGLLVLDELRASSEPRDALTRELDHFVDCVARRRTPRTSFSEGLAVVDVLERAAADLEAEDTLAAGQ